MRPTPTQSKSAQDDDKISGGWKSRKRINKINKWLIPLSKRFTSPLHTHHNWALWNSRAEITRCIFHADNKAAWIRYLKKSSDGIVKLATVGTHLETATRLVFPLFDSCKRYVTQSASQLEALPSTALMFQFLFDIKRNQRAPCPAQQASEWKTESAKRTKHSYICIYLLMTWLRNGKNKMRRKKCAGWNDSRLAVYL